MSFRRGHAAASPPPYSAQPGAAQSTSPFSSVAADFSQGLCSVTLLLHAWEETQEVGVFYESVQGDAGVT